jgi:hypothetical protein
MGAGFWPGRARDGGWVASRIRSPVDRSGLNKQCPPLPRSGTGSGGGCSGGSRAGGAAHVVTHVTHLNIILKHRRNIKIIKYKNDWTWFEQEFHFNRKFT